MDRVFAQECVCGALAGPRVIIARSLIASATEKNVGGGSHLSQAPPLHIPVWQNPLVQAGFPQEKKVLASAALFAYLLAFTLSKTFSLALHVQKKLSGSFTSVFIPILVLCGTDTFKEPHQQSIYIEEKVLQIWTPLDYDNPQVLGNMSF